MNWPFKVVFLIFFVSLFATVAGSILMLWVARFQTEMAAKAVGTSAILTLGAAFCIAMCDAWNRVIKGQQEK